MATQSTLVQVICEASAKFGNVHCIIQRAIVPYDGAREFLLMIERGEGSANGTWFMTINACWHADTGVSFYSGAYDLAREVAYEHMQHAANRDREVLRTDAQRIEKGNAPRYRTA